MNCCSVILLEKRNRWWLSYLNTGHLNLKLTRSTAALQRKHYQQNVTVPPRMVRK